MAAMKNMCQNKDALHYRKDDLLVLKTVIEKKIVDHHKQHTNTSSTYSFHCLKDWLFYTQDSLG